MSIQKMISEISRKAGSLEVVQFTRTTDSKIKSKDLLSGVYMSDGFVEIRGASGMEIEIEENRWLKFEKISSNIYRIYNININLVIRPIE